jgi:hypothetical protein
MTAPTTCSASNTNAALPIYKRRVELPLYLSPVHLLRPLSGVRDQLNRSNLRFVEHFNGVLLSFEGLRLLRPLGRIAYDAPEIHVRAEFDATFFAPKPGDRIEGTVSRIGADHIALLVMGIFNGSVALPDGWDHSRPSVQPEDTVTFVVRSVQHANGLLSMHGELAPAAEGATASPAGGADGGAARAAKKSAPKQPAATKAPANGGTPAAAAAAPAAASSAPAAAPAAAASAGSSAAAVAADEAATAKRKRTPEEKEARRQRKAQKAAAAASSTG